MEPVNGAVYVAGKRFIGFYGKFRDDAIKAKSATYFHKAYFFFFIQFGRCFPST
jgi:hypothetical protein